MQPIKTIKGNQSYYLIADFINKLKSPEELIINYYYKNRDSIIEDYFIKHGIQLHIEFPNKLIACLFDIDINNTYKKVFSDYCENINAKNKVNLLVNIKLELSENENDSVSAVTNKLISIGDGTYIRQIIVIDYFWQTIQSTVTIVNNNIRGNPLYEIQKNYFNNWLNNEIIDLFSLKNEKCSLEQLTSEKLSSMFFDFIADTDKHNFISNNVLQQSNKDFKNCNLSSMTLNKIDNELIQFKKRENLYKVGNKTADVRYIINRLSLYGEYLFEKLGNNNFSSDIQFINFVSYSGNCISLSAGSFFFNSLVQQKCQIIINEINEKFIIDLYAGKTKLLSLDPITTYKPEYIIMKCFEDNMLKQIRNSQNDDILNDSLKKYQEKINHDIHTSLQKESFLLLRSELLPITSENIHNNTIPVKINYMHYSKDVLFVSEEGLKEDIQMFLNEVEKKIINENHNIVPEKDVFRRKKKVRL